MPIDTNVPQVSKNYGENAAFLFIPGYSRDSDNKQPKTHSDRLKFEKQLIKKAIYRGQPILAVCAGGWTLWQAYGGTLKDVSDHNYGAGMPRLSTIAPTVVNNKLIHRVRTVAETLLSQSMDFTMGDDDIPVNSVHWQAVDPQSKNISSNIKISATSVQDDELAPNSRQSKKMKPDNCAEAFETIHGVPMMGIQWHPEAFNPTDDAFAPHQGIFKAIQTAGMTYLNRRVLNDEYAARWEQEAYSCHSFFKPKDTEEECVLADEMSKLTL